LQEIIHFLGFKFDKDGIESRNVEGNLLFE